MDVDSKINFDPRLNSKDCEEIKIKSLPESINVVDHVTERIREFGKVYSELNVLESEKLVHQLLPNHMRRRAMSHNPLRIPRKYRKMHINQMAKSGSSAKKKRPSRKYRRRANNLMKEYIRRQRNNIWLETHIWHAKRFHMSNLWGYKIPYSSCDKRYRGSYKAISKHCLVTDISYYNAIEISGPLELLKEKFSRLRSSETGLSITAKPFLGSREGLVDLFKIDSYPLNAIGRVSVLWKPEQESDTNRTVWIFAHPTIYQTLIDEFIILFDLQNSNSKTDEATSQEINSLETQEKPEGSKKSSEKFKKYRKKKELQLKFITRNNSFVRYPVYANSDSGITLTELKDTLNRFRLTGPLTNAILTNSFKIANNDYPWLKNWLESNSIHGTAFENQEEFWKALSQSTSPAEVPPHTVLALNIIDPRTNRPVKRKKSEVLQNNAQDILDIPEFSNYSSIWDRTARDSLINNLMPTQKLCKLRNEQGLVPGVTCKFEKDLQPLPILLIQRPGSQCCDLKRLGFASGWDIIVPAGYGLSCWLNFIYNGAKSGGWRDIMLMDNESGKDTFLPDTVAGQKEDVRIGKSIKEKYFKMPPNKRPNYRKLGIASPFFCPFQQLVVEWSDSDSYFVLRNKQTLNELKKTLNLRNVSPLPEIPQNCLIPISVTTLRGNIDNNAIICLPTKKDFKKFLINKYMRDRTPILTEPLHKDPDENQRKTIRFNHKNLLKKLRNRRVRAKRKLQKNSKYFVKIQKSDTEKLVEEQYEKMCELWVPSKAETIRNQCSRETIGYLTNSRFTYSESNVCGVGYVAARGFVELVNSFRKFKAKEFFVLVRSSNSRHFHTAFIKIRIDL